MAGKKKAATKKDVAGRDKEPQVRGRGGPSSATRNERAQGRRRRGIGDARALPKIGKHESSEGGSSGGGLH